MTFASTDPLLQAFPLKHPQLRNRLVRRCQLYDEEKAMGGIAVTVIGGWANVGIDSPSAFGQLYAGHDATVPYFRQLADRVHAHGAAVRSQITHMGRRTGDLGEARAAHHRAV